MQLNDRQTHALIHLPDHDMNLDQARSLYKAASDGRRKRTTPNIFTTLSGKAQPREGFLSVEILRAIYLRSELVRACVDTLIEFVSAVPWDVRPVDKERSQWLKRRKPEEYLEQRKRIEWLKKFFTRPNNYENLDQFHRRLLRDLLIFDAGAYEIVRAEYPEGGTLPLELGVVAGDTVEIETDDHGLPAAYHQSYNVLHNVEYERDELGYLMLNPCSWSPYGISPIETAYVSIASDLNANKYNSDVFAKDNIPPGLLAVLGVSPSEFRNLMSQMRNVSRDNPHNLHAMRVARNPDGTAQKVFEYTPLQSSNREMQYKELLTMCINRVTMMYKLTPSQIGFTEQVSGGIGSGVAETQVDLTQNKGVAPLIKLLADAHTYNVIESVCGWDDLEFAFTQSNTPQEQAEYARDSQELGQGVTTINQFRAKWGGRKPLEWGDKPIAPLPYYQPPPTPEQLQQQMMGMQMGGAPPPQSGQQPGQPPALPPGGQPPPPGQMQKAAKRIIINF